MLVEAAGKSKANMVANLGSGKVVFFIDGIFFICVHWKGSMSSLCFFYHDTNPTREGVIPVT